MFRNNLSFFPRESRHFLPLSKFSLENIFITLLSNNKSKNIFEKIMIVKKIVKAFVIKAYMPEEINHFSQLIQSLPCENPLETLCSKLLNRPVIPVITSHPTMVLSEPSLQCLHTIAKYTYALEMYDVPLCEKEYLFTEIERNIHYLINNSMLPENKMTPKQEAERALFIYKEMLMSYPIFLDKAVNEFIRIFPIYDGDKNFVTDKLRDGIKAQYLNIRSWVAGDADGNNNKSAETMQEFLILQQSMLLKMHIEALNNIIFLIQKDKTIFIHEYKLIEERIYLFTKLYYQIQKNILLSPEVGNKIKNETLVIFKKINFTVFTPYVKQKLDDFVNIFDLVGLNGGMIGYIRQTTLKYSSVLDNIFIILSNHKKEISEKIYINNITPRFYNELDWNEKSSLLILLNSNKNEYFSILHQNKNHLSDDTCKELDRLFFVLKHPTDFPYHVFSDTKSVINIHELDILSKLAANLKSDLSCTESSTIQPILLCETPEDMKNIKQIFKEMLDDPLIRKKIVKNKMISCVLGPSDLGKTGGIMTHIDLYAIAIEIGYILQEYKKKYSELEDVNYFPLQGHGASDFNRSLGWNLYHHTTHQGVAAYNILGAPHAYIDHIERLAGWPCEYEKKVEELRQIEKYNPVAFKILFDIKEKCVKFFIDYINQESTKEVLRKTAYRDLESYMNTSSRAASKSSSDPNAARAIGFLNHHLLTGNHSNIWMSLAGLVQSNDEEKKLLPILFDRSSIIKNIIYKTFYAIATSNTNRTWRRLLGRIPTQEEQKQWYADYLDQKVNQKLPEHSLSYQIQESITVMKNMTFFLPETQQIKANSFFSNNKIENIRHIALHLMYALGNDFKKLAMEIEELIPDFDQLDKYLLEYESDDKNLQKVELCVLAVRGTTLLTAGTSMIMNSQSELAKYSLVEKENMSHKHLTNYKM